MDSCTTTKIYRKLPLKQKSTVPYFITKLDRRDSNYEAIISRQILLTPTWQLFKNTNLGKTMSVSLQGM